MRKEVELARLSTLVRTPDSERGVQSIHRPHALSVPASFASSVYSVLASPVAGICMPLVAAIDSRWQGIVKNV